MDVFFDPVLRAPTLGCMLMSLGASLVGVLAFLRKQSLIGEALSHSAYPGVIVGVMVAALFSYTDVYETSASLIVLGGAFLSALLGGFVIYQLKKRKIPSDAALCLVLSLFFGVGVTLASHVQFSHATLYQQSLVYLYGQAATMTDQHIVIYGSLALVILLIVLLFYKEWKVICFDPKYAKTLGMPVSFLEGLIFTLIAFSIIVGIRSVGVVLMSAMLVAPAAAARQFTHRFSVMLFLAAFFGVLSGYLGNRITATFGNYVSLPTGPMIVLVAAVICLLSLFFAPERGLVLRYLRALLFRYRCHLENVLKALRRKGSMSLEELSFYFNSAKLSMRAVLWQLCRTGWIERVRGSYHLTRDGAIRADRIVRLHRLWEVYLVDYLGVNAERVHRNAEEMEHILTKEIEEELTKLLKDPKEDPHKQPIPPKGGL